MFNRPGQQERVLHAQNEVICTEQHTGIMLSFPTPVSCKQKHIMYHVSSITTQLVVLNKHTMQFRCLLMVGLFCSMQFGWSPLHFAVYYGHLNIVNQLVNVCRLPPEQKTKVRMYGWPRTVCMHACQVQVACPLITACLLNGPNRTDHFACFVVNRPIRIQSTYGGRLSNAQWNSLLRVPIMCGLDSICIQSNSRLRLDRSIVLEPVVARVVASHAMAQPQEVGWLHNQGASG